jgi:hypothetical protein
MVKIGNFPYSATKQMLDKAKKPGFEYDVMPDYDFVINRSGKLLTTKYVVDASRKDTPLTEEEKLEMEEKMNQTSLLEIIEKMQKRQLEKIQGSPTAPEQPVTLHDARTEPPLFKSAKGTGKDKLDPTEATENESINF